MHSSFLRAFGSSGSITGAGMGYLGFPDLELLGIDCLRSAELQPILGIVEPHSG